LGRKGQPDVLHFMQFSGQVPVAPKAAQARAPGESGG
jgi:hypothetical protein